MLEIFIELTNQLFWTGYAEQLAAENPAGFQMELAEFTDSYNSYSDAGYGFFTGQSDHHNHS